MIGRGRTLPMLLIAAAPLAAQPSPAQPAVVVRASVAPDTVTVGDRFQAAVRVLAPVGSRVRFGALPISDSLQPTAPLRAVPPERAAGATAIYELTAWVAGLPLRASVPVTVLLPGGDSLVYRVPLRLPVVRSVLPAGEQELAPRPPRGVVALPPAPSAWPWVVAALAALLAVALAWHAWRRRPVAPRPAADPRGEALAEIQALLRSGERDPVVLATHASRVLRRFLAARSPAWGEEWTSGEIVGRLRADAVEPAATARLERLLTAADQIRFSGRPGQPEAARALVEEVGAWIGALGHASPAREAA